MTYKTKKGHLRISSGPDRGKYVHRKVIEELLVSHPTSFWGSALPAHIDVHHIDGRKDHNCPCNLLLLDHAIHSVIERGKFLRHPYTGRFMTPHEYAFEFGPREVAPPDWVTTEYEECA